MKDDNKTVSMNILGMPKDIHKSFKMICADLEISMNDMVIDLVRQCVSKNKHKVLK